MDVLLYKLFVHGGYADVELLLADLFSGGKGCTTDDEWSIYFTGDFITDVLCGYLWVCWYVSLRFSEIENGIGDLTFLQCKR